MSTLSCLGRWASVFASIMALVRPVAAQERVLDAFDSLEGWRVIVAEGVRGSIALDEAGLDGSCLRLDFEFVTGGGYCIVQKDFDIALPENYEFAFWCRAPAGTPTNDLEFKLLDESGENVWWLNRRATSFPTSWTRLVNKKRQIQFAWGPAGAQTPLTKLSKLELVIASSTGGKGSVYFDSLTFRALPVPRAYAGTPIVTASSGDPEAPAVRALDGDAETAWISGPSRDGRSHSLTIDFGELREMGGVSIAWARDGEPGAFDVLLSDDGAAWTAVYRSAHAAPRVSHAPLGDATSRFVRLDLRPRVRSGGGVGPVGVGEVTIREPEFAEPNELYATIARESARGLFPPYFLGEQRFWTVVGDFAGGEREALLGTDGTVEVDKRSFSIEPFIVEGGRVLTWADGAHVPTIEAGALHRPAAGRRAGGFLYGATTHVDSTPGREAIYVTYGVVNETDDERACTLVLAIRPFQVNPPSQWLNTPGGVASVRSLLRVGNDVLVNGRQLVAFAGTDPARIEFCTFDQGDASAFLIDGTGLGDDAIVDPRERASALVRFPLVLPPAGRAHVVTVLPSAPASADAQGQIRPAYLRGEPAEVARRIRAMHDAAPEEPALDRVRFTLPPMAEPLWRAARAQIAYILINRDGPAIQPGSRSYERSWARDGSMTSAALLEFGLEREVREWIEWFASHQFPSGKVPCVVDRRGPDPVNEHDSHGQLIFAIANYYRYTRDEAFVRRLWPNVHSAVAYIESIRAERLTPEFAPGSAGTRQEPGKPAVPASAFYGLVPESISHEGYSAKPMHSYWDNFFVLLGLKEAAYIAGVLGEREAEVRWRALAGDFRRTLLASLDAARHAHGIDYLPGCVELGDFDATSTTVALWPCGETGHLPREALRATFERAWQFFVRRRDDASFQWVDYTPYENRLIGSYLRLGQRERALQYAEFMLSGRRPAAWNQWPEVVYRDERAPKFLGDLPHTWCGSDFLNAFRAMFAYEREGLTDGDGESLVLLAGVPERWLVQAGEAGLGFEGLPTPHGKLDVRAVLVGEEVRVRVSGVEREPAGGVWIADPFKDAGDPVRLGGSGPGVREVSIRRAE